jgi:cytochrome c556
MSFFRPAILAIVLLLGFAGFASAAMTDAQLVAARVAAMKEDARILKQAKSLSGDAAVAAASKILNNFSNFPSLFRPNSITPHSRATPRIW